MPLYEYQCANGHHFEQTVKFDLSNAPTSCDFPMPEGTPCEKEVTRVLSTPSRSFPGADSWRK